MSDLISRQAAIEVLEWFDQTDPLGHTPGQIVRALPTAEPRKGEWVKEWRSANGYTRINGYKCSRCIVVYPWKTNYCPNCGARMEVSE